MKMKMSCWLAAGIGLLMAMPLWGGIKATAVTHHDVYVDSANFAGWPANEGVWSWNNGQEILTAAYVAEYEEQEDTHNHKIGAPALIKFMRSTDGGVTWGAPVTFPNVKATGNSPTALPPAGVDFTSPGLAMRLRLGSVWVSTDKGASWAGPYQIPTGPNGERVTARTSYIVEDANTCLFFVSYECTKNTYTYSRSALLKSTDGLRSFQFVTWIGDDIAANASNPDLATGNVFSIMPQAVKTGPNSYICTLRQRINAAKWTDIYKTTDGGATWTFLSELERGSTNPASLVSLDGGNTTVAVYGSRRAAPLGIFGKISEDQGATWGPEITLRDDGREWDLGYVVAVPVVESGVEKVAAMYYYTTMERMPNFIAATRWNALEPLVTPTSEGVVVDDKFDGATWGTQTFNSTIGTYESLGWSVRYNGFINISNNQLVVTNNGTGQMAIGQFLQAPVDMPVAGTMRVSFDFKPSGAAITAGASTVRFGVYNSNNKNTYPAGGTSGGTGSVDASVSGYRFGLGANMGAAGDKVVIEKRNLAEGALINGGHTILGNTPVVLPDSQVLTVNTTYHMDVLFERLADIPGSPSNTTVTKINLTVSGGGLGSNITASVTDNGTINENGVTRFDTFVLYVQNTCTPITYDNLKITAGGIPMEITTQPVVEQTVYEYSPATFSVAASGVGLSYQWRFNGGDIPGATSNTYTIPAVRPSNAGDYTVVISSANGASLTSDASALFVTEIPADEQFAPEIVTQPSGTTAAPGMNAMFAVEAEGSPLLTYQWRKEGVAIANATNATYVISPVAAGDAGNYSVEVSNAFGNVTSIDAKLTIVETVDMPMTARIVVDDQFNETGMGNQTWNATTGTYTALGWSVRYNGFSAMSNGQLVVTMNGSGQTTIGQFSNSAPELVAGGTMRLSFDFTPTGTLTANNATSIRFGIYDSAGQNTFPPGTISGGTGGIGDKVAGYRFGVGGNMTSAGNKASIEKKDSSASLVNGPHSPLTSVAAMQPDTQVLSVGTAYHMDVLFKRQPDLVGVNGTTAVTDITMTVNGGDLSSNITASVTDNGAVNGQGVTRFDVLALYVQSQCSPIAYDNLKVLVDEPVRITQQPQGLVHYEHETAVFSVESTGVGVTYQWYKDGVILADDARVSGSANTTLTITGLTTADAGSYTVKVNGGSIGGVATPVESDAAVLAVNVVPPSLQASAVITRQPKGAILDIGDTATFFVKATGVQPFTYQWRKDGKAIAGETGDTLTIAGVAVKDGGRYDVVITNYYGTTTSDAVVLKVLAPPVFTVDLPANPGAWFGKSAVLSVKVSSKTKATYQWYKDGAPIGGNSASFKITKATAVDAGQYWVVVTNSEGSVTSNTANFWVGNPPKIIEPYLPKSVDVRGNVGTALTVAVDADPEATPLTYTWRYNGRDIPSSNSTTLQAGNKGSYDVRVSNPGGSVMSSKTSIKVHLDPVLPFEAGFTVNSTLKLSTAGSSLKPTTYKWYYSSDNGTTFTDLINGNGVSGATTPTLKIAKVQTERTGQYKVERTNILGAIESNVCKVYVGTPAKVTLNPVSRRVIAGDAVVFTSNMTGSDPLTGQWLFNNNALYNNGTRIMGNTTLDLSITEVLPTDAGSYSFRARNPLKVSVSKVAKLSVDLAPNAPESMQLIETSGNTTLADVTFSSPGVPLWSGTIGSVTTNGTYVYKKTSATAATVNCTYLDTTTNKAVATSMALKFTDYRVVTVNATTTRKYVGTFTMKQGGKTTGTGDFQLIRPNPSPAPLAGAVAEAGAVNGSGLLDALGLGLAGAGDEGSELAGAGVKLPTSGLGAVELPVSVGGLKLWFEEAGGAPVCYEMSFADGRFVEMPSALVGGYLYEVLDANAGKAQLTLKPDEVGSVLDYLLWFEGAKGGKFEVKELDGEEAKREGTFSVEVPVTE